MKITKARLKQIIKEELEVTLTNEEAGEMFGEEVQTQLEEQELNEILSPEQLAELPMVITGLVKLGATFGIPMLAALIARVGYEAFLTAFKGVDETLKNKNRGWLVDFIEQEIKGYNKDLKEAPAGLPTGDIQTSDKAGAELGKARLGSTLARKQAIDKATGELVASGISDRERAVIQNIQTALVKAAGSGDITTGAVLRYLKQLLAELEKLG